MDVFGLDPWPEVRRRAADDVSAVVGRLPEMVTSGAGADDVNGVVVVAGLVLAEPEAEEGDDDARQESHHGEGT